MTDIKRPKPAFVAPVGMTFPRGNSDEALTMGQLQDNIEQLARTDDDLQAQLDALSLQAAAVEEPERVRRVRTIRKPLEVEELTIRMVQILPGTGTFANVAPDFVAVLLFPLTDPVNPFSINVLLPHLLRSTGNEGAANAKSYPNGDMITYTHLGDNQSQQRTALEAGGETETQTITPQYHKGEILVIGRLNEDLVIDPSDAFGTTIGDPEPRTTPWTDLNAAGRHWAV